MLQIGSLVDGRYKILSEVGRGGMSVVYMAINEKANKTWAVKEVRKDGKMDFNMVRQGLLAEIDTLKKLKHPNLPSIVDVIEDDDSFVIVMDYIEGRSLDKIIAENGAQPESYVVEWAKQLCDVFGYLHSRTPPIIYRDMKPANVMLKPDGNIMVIDFGTAKNYEINYGETTGIGTIGYAAPEQYINSGLGRTDARTDIYCLGITMYHLLTDVDPCKNLISNRSVRAINPALSRGLDAIIQKCTEHNPNDRYQSCAELMYDLDNYEELEPKFKKKQKRKLGLFIITLFLSIAFAVSGFVLNAAASKKATDTYETKLYEASKTTDYESKIGLYEECIAIPNKAGEKEAYLGLIQTFKEDDNVFSVEEAKLLEKLIKNNQESLRKDTDSYVEICFETGKLFWYYYNYGEGSQLVRAKSSVQWFQDVIENADENYENMGMAKVYANIGMFYRDIDTNINEGQENGKFSELYRNLTELMSTVAADGNESEIVRFELIELTRSALQKYATNLKKDGIQEDELMSLYGSVEDAVNSIEATAGKAVDLQASTKSNLEATLESIRKAYATDAKGGETK